MALTRVHLKLSPFKLDPLDKPGRLWSMTRVDHRMFVSESRHAQSRRGKTDQNIALKNQNVAVIDVLNNTLVHERIPPRGGIKTVSGR